MRCEQCARFVSYGEREPEVEPGDVIDGRLPVEIRVVLPCSECCTDLKETNFDWVIDLGDVFDLDAHPPINFGDVEVGEHDKFHVIRAESPEEGWFVLFYKYEKRRVKDKQPYYRPVEPTYEDVLTYVDKRQADSKEGCDRVLKEFTLCQFNKGRWDVNASGTFSERYEGNGRHSKTFYGADVEVVVTDTFTGKQGTFTKSFKERSSNFDDC